MFLIFQSQKALSSHLKVVNHYVKVHSLPPRPYSEREALWLTGKCYKNHVLPVCEFILHSGGFDVFLAYTKSAGGLRCPSYL